MYLNKQQKKELLKKIKQTLIDREVIRGDLKEEKKEEKKPVENSLFTKLEYE